MAGKIDTVKGDNAATGQPKFDAAAIKPVPDDICERIYNGWDGEVLPTPPLENTMQPFAAGDIFTSCTYLNNPYDNHAGVGRIVQYDKDLNYKGVLWVPFTTHLIVHLRFDPQGNLWGCDCQGHHMVLVTPDGKLQPETSFADIGLASPCFLSDGTVLLADYFMDVLKKKYGKAKKLSSLSSRILQTYSWPGNVRELKNTLERVFIFSENDLIEEGEISLESDEGCMATGDLKTLLCGLEQKIIIQSLAANGGNRTNTAAQLGISLRNLQYKLSRYDLID